MINQKKGFVLAFSLLISSIVLALAFGIFNILLKQIVLTGSAKDSQIAFYAADAGAECALYWDTHTSRTLADEGFYDTEGNYRYSYRGIFALSADHPDRETDEDLSYPDASDVKIFLNQGSNFICGNAIITNTIDVSEVSNVAETSFEFNLTLDAKVCSKVTVRKGLKIDGTSFDTVIKSFGYNDCNTTNTRRVERAIEVKY